MKKVTSIRLSDNMKQRVEFQVDRLCSKGRYYHRSELVVAALNYFLCLINAESKDQAIQIVDELLKDC